MMSRADMAALFRIEDENHGDGQRYAQPATTPGQQGQGERQQKAKGDGQDSNAMPNAMDKSRQCYTLAPSPPGFLTIQAFISGIYGQPVRATR
jgi:hypothetical protein